MPGISLDLRKVQAKTHNIMGTPINYEKPGSSNILGMRDPSYRWTPGGYVKQVEPITGRPIGAGEAAYLEEKRTTEKALGAYTTSQNEISNTKEISLETITKDITNSSEKRKITEMDKGQIGQILIDKEEIFCKIGRYVLFPYSEITINLSYEIRKRKRGNRMRRQISKTLPDATFAKILP